MHDYESAYNAYNERIKNSVRSSEYYKVMKKYILRAYEKGDNIPLDFRGRLKIAYLASERFALQERAPDGMTNCFNQLIADLCEEGILRKEHSLGGEWYEKLTEKEVRAKSSNKEEIDTKGKAHISRRKKKEMKKNENNPTKTDEGR